MQKVLFLNPPAPDGRRYNRHVMDPHVSKGDYLYPPYDFLMLSGYFYPSQRFELKILDSIAECHSTVASEQAIRAFRPDFILALTAPQSHRADLAWLEGLKKKLGVPIFTLGAVQHARKRRMLERHPWMDGIVIEPLGDDLRRYLEGESGPFPNLLLQGEEPQPAAGRLPSKRFDLPMPRHDLLDLRRYRYPGMHTASFTATLASYGCPYTCTYCEAPSFYYGQREPEEVIEELRFIRSLGVREVCFKDWTFGAHRARTAKLLDAMIEEDLGLVWFTFSRANVLDRDLLVKMKRAGCHTLQIGVETAQDEILKNFQRSLDRAQLEVVFRTARELGIATLATLVLGLPGDDEAGIRRTIDYTIQLAPDFASFNIITPLVGSVLRDEMERNGQVDPEDYECQDSTRASIRGLAVSATRLEELRDLAVRRFYFRPRYLIRRLRKLRSLSQLRHQTAVGWSLFRQHVMGDR